MLYYVEWDLNHNSLFVVGNRVWDQVRGVSIRGALSTQLPLMLCMVREAKFYEQEDKAINRRIRRFHSD